MKKYILIVLLVLPLNSFAFDDCPYGKTDSSCEYPGECGRYTDTDNNKICDHSQPEPTLQITPVTTPIMTPPENIKMIEEKQPVISELQVDENNLAQNIVIEDDVSIEDEGLDEHDIITGKELKTKTVAEVALLYKINTDDYADKLSQYLNTKVLSTSHFQDLHSEYNLEPDVAKDIASSLIEVNNLKPKYPLIPLAVVIIIAYGITYFLAKKKTITMITHKKIWNIILTISFLAVALSGLLLVIQINFGTSFAFPFNTLYWHVVTGIIMAIITIFHIGWHWRYYKNIFK